MTDAAETAQQMKDKHMIDFKDGLGDEIAQGKVLVSKAWLNASRAALFAAGVGVGVLATWLI